MTSLLAPEEVALLLPRRRLKARTYRVPPGSTLLIGGLARLDILTAPGATIYLTVFVSGARSPPFLICPLPPAAVRPRTRRRHGRSSAKTFTPPLP